MIACLSSAHTRLQREALCCRDICDKWTKVFASRAVNGLHFRVAWKSQCQVGRLMRSAGSAFAWSAVESNRDLYCFWAVSLAHIHTHTRTRTHTHTHTHKQLDTQACFSVRLWHRQQWNSNDRSRLLPRIFQWWLGAGGTSDHHQQKFSCFQPLPSNLCWIFFSLQLFLLFVLQGQIYCVK